MTNQAESDRQRQALIQRFPYQFRETQAMNFGPGWTSLFAQVCEDVHALLPESLRDDFCWTDLKEDYGELSLGFQGPSVVLEAIEAAEDASADICEICGAKGTLYTEGRRKTRCQAHRNA